MTEQEFQHSAQAAETFRRLAEPDRADFWTGYQRGLRRHYHGEKFGTAAEHSLWLAAADDDDHQRRQRGLGYRCGLAGTPATSVQTT